MEQAARPGKTPSLHAVGKDAVVADSNETSGYDMEQEAPGELGSWEGHGLPAPLVLAILIDEGDAAVLVRDEPFVADGDAVRVAAEIA